MYNISSLRVKGKTEETGRREDTGNWKRKH